MRKRPVLILELLISLALFSFIMGILFSSFKDLSRTKYLLKQQRPLILNRQKLQLRLSQILSSTIQLKKENGEYLLTYDNGLDIDPLFRGEVQGKLYIDAGRLALVTWPDKGKGRKEILWESADSFSLNFFDTKCWSSDYPSEKPLMVQVVIDQLILPLFL